MKELLLADDYAEPGPHRPRPGGGRRPRARRLRGPQRARGRGGADAHAGEAPRPERGRPAGDRLHRGRRGGGGAQGAPRALHRQLGQPREVGRAGAQGAAAGAPLRRGGGRHDHRREGHGADARSARSRSPAARWRWRASTACRRRAWSSTRSPSPSPPATRSTATARWRRWRGIRRIKAENPGVFTSLGVCNVCFGLARPAREVLNSVFLYHAVQAGLDLAIVNPARHPRLRRARPKRSASWPRT